jgi:type IV secretory pathway TraG/TraD family ATPase VirD4
LFFERSQQSSQPFFPNAARDLFAAVLLHFYRLHKRTPLPTPPNNQLLRTFFEQATLDTFREILLLPENADLRALISYIGANGTSDQSLGVLSELQQMVREIFVGNFKKAGTLSARQLVRNKNATCVFIDYDIAVGNVLAPIYRLIIDFAIKESLSRTKSDGHVWFFIDEFRLIPHLQHIDNGVNFGRSLGARFIIGVQNIAQINHAYGDALAASLLSGFLTCVSFRVNDASTRDFVKQRHGKRRIQEITAPAIGNQGVQSQTVDVDVVEDKDILMLRRGQAIIGLPSNNPFLFEFKAYKRG